MEDNICPRVRKLYGKITAYRTILQMAQREFKDYTREGNEAGVKRAELVIGICSQSTRELLEKWQQLKFRCITSRSKVLWHGLDAGLSTKITFQVLDQVKVVSK